MPGSRILRAARIVKDEHAELLAALTSDLPDDPNDEKDHRDDPEHMEQDARDREKNARDHPKDDETRSRNK